MNQKQYLTKTGYEDLKNKLEELKKEQKENIVALQDARAQGDLSENADYDAARDNQARIASAIKEVENNLKNAIIITGDDNSNLGKLITVKFLDDSEEETYQIVGTIEADPLDQKISDESPLGKAIIHAKVGDIALVKTEDGEKFEVSILDIRLPEESKKKSKTVKKK